MPTYRWDGDAFVDKKTGEEMELPFKGQALAPLAIIPDTPDYHSPVTGELISGRVARREDMKKHGCVEYDAPKDQFCRTERWAKRLNKPLKGRDC